MTLIRKLTLIAKTYTTDSIGQPTVAETTRDVICELRSVSGTEFSQARQNGINPQYVFILSMFDYKREQEVEFEGVRYSIYRTYIADDNSIELYAEVQTGVTNA